MSKYLALIPLLPLLGFLTNGLLRNKLSKTAVSIIGCGVMFLAFILSIVLFIDVKAGNGGVVELFNFINVTGIRIPFAFQADALSSLFLLIITGVGFLIHVYSTSYMHDEEAPHFARYFAYLNLFVFSMLLLVLGANYVIMFIGWEGVGLCSYLLIGYWFKNKDYTNAAKKAFVMNRIGDLAFLVALFWLMGKTGSLTFTEILKVDVLTKLTATDITGITLLLFIGATGKSAQIPLYTWLPDAMAGPTPVSALIHAATMVTAGIYMIVRSNVLYTAAPTTMNIIAIVGLATAILAATIALKQNDIKKVLAYSTVSQLGFMFLALGTGAYTAAVFHVMTHAFFKALLFLGSGSVIHAMGGEQDITKMGGLNKYMKITYATFFIGCLAIAGIPPLSGFFSKDAILLSAFLENKILYSFALFAAILTAYYMFRLLFLTFHGSFRGTKHQQEHLHESPTAMTVPLIVLALLSTIGGFIGIPEVFAKGANYIVDFLNPVVKDIAHLNHVSHSTEYLLMGLAIVLVIASIAYAWINTKNYTSKEETGLSKVLQNKWYVDEIYDASIVQPIQATGNFFNRFIEKIGLDGIVNGIGKGIHGLSRQFRLLQNGQIGFYILLMVAGLVIAVMMGVYRLDFSWVQKLF
jgi:NADH-quinone oxidoreductase subunit L